jgi:hypothetical protein
MNWAMFSAIQFLSTFAALAAVQAAVAEPFVWRYGGYVIGRLSVPAGFTAETYNYREGIVTTLCYTDGASIILQVGGMYRLPLFQGPDYKLVSSTELPGKRIRVGYIAGATLLWREDNFKPEKRSGNTVGIESVFPPNVGYARVPQARRAEFDYALDSFVPEVERAPDRNPQRVRAAALVSKVEPAYPVVAQNRGIQGAVWLDAVIGKDGHVTSVQSISGKPLLVNAAKNAMMQWVYTPTLLNGEPIEAIMKVCVPFVTRLSKQTPAPCAQPAGPIR